MRLEHFACLQAIERAAVGTLRFPGFRDIQKHARMIVVNGHPCFGTRAKDPALSVQVFCAQFNG